MREQMSGESGFPERVSPVRSLWLWLRKPLWRPRTGPGSAAQVPLRLALAAVAVSGVIAYVVMASDGYISAQDDGTTPSVTEPTGKLVVAPRPVQVEEKPVAVGFHVEPADLEVTLEYSEHFVPDGESCMDYTASRTTTPQAAPTWVTLEACTIGEGYVRLIASSTGEIIEEVNVSVHAEGTRQDLRAASISLSGVPSQLEVGRSGFSSVSVSGLNDSSEVEYELHVVSLNQKLAFNSGCNDHDKFYGFSEESSFFRSPTIWACDTPGSYLWAYMDSYQDGYFLETISTGLTEHYVEIVCPSEGCTPTISGAQSVSYNEDATDTVATYTAEDPDGDNVTWSLDGDDDSEFSIDSSNGALRFVRSPNYESPTDTGTDNVYNVTVVATDDSSSALSSELAVTVTVLNVDEPGSITLSPSNPSVGTTITATLNDPDGSVTNTSWQWQRSSNGTSGWTTISGATGSSYTAASDDEGEWLRARASYRDGHGTGKSATSQSVSIAAPTPPTISGAQSPSYNENATGTVATYTAMDDDGDNVTWSLDGDDDSKFSIDSSRGALRFVRSPDYESPTDTGTDNVYNVTVVATDDSSSALSSELAVTVTVLNVDEPGSITLSPSNPSVGTTITATLNDPDGSVTNTSWQWQRSSNGTSGWTTISGATGSSYTAASDDEGEWLRARASYRDGHGTGKSATSQSVSIAAPTPPTISGAQSPSYNENATGTVATYTAMDDDGDNVTWSLDGDDDSKFSIDSSRGALRFVRSPDYESPTDTGTDNVYNVTVVATDDSSSALSSELAVTVTVLNVDEPGSITLSPSNPTVGTTITATLSDPDGSVTNTSWQWQRSSNGTSGWTTISGATGSSYTAASDDEGEWLRARASYRDGHGTGKSAQSSPTSQVAVTFPTFSTEPIPSIGSDRRSISVTYTLPSDSSFDYQLALLRSDSDTFGTFVVADYIDNPPASPHVLTAYIFTGSYESGYYKAALRACLNSTCGPYTMSLNTLIKLAMPEGLDVSPMALRKAKLTWEPSSNADSNTVYDIHAQAPSGSSAIVAMGVRTSSLEHVIDLDSVVSGKGLADEDYFKLWIVARSRINANLDSEANDEIRIIDNPLLESGGRAYATGRGEASLQWETEGNASNYTIRYRQLGNDHTDLGWANSEGWPYHQIATSLPPDSAGRKTISGLIDDEIYAFQVNYEIGDDLFFSGRDAYVWPSSSYPEHNERVATYAFFGHHLNREYRYVICNNPSISASEMSDWADVVSDAFSAWQEATGGWVKLIGNRDTCGASGDPITTEYIIQDDTLSEVRFIDPSTAPNGIMSFPQMKSDVFKVCLRKQKAGACTTSFLGYSGLDTDEYTDPDHRTRLAELIQMAINGMLNPLEYRDLRGRLDAADAFDRQASNELQGVDVTFNLEYFDRKSIDTPVSTPFNSCPSDGKDYDAYELAVHEAGHALGLSDIDYGTYLSWSNAIANLFGRELPDQPYEAAHPTIPDSVLNYDDELGYGKPWATWSSDSSLEFSEPDCGPHPFDVLAIYALYQHVPRTGSEVD